MCCQSKHLPRSVYISDKNPLKIAKKKFFILYLEGNCFVKFINNSRIVFIVTYFVELILNMIFTFYCLSDLKL